MILMAMVLSSHTSKYHGNDYQYLQYSSLDGVSECPSDPKHGTSPRISMSLYTRCPQEEAEEVAGWQTQVSHVQQADYGV